MARKHYCERATFIYGGGYFDCSVHMFHDRLTDRQAQSGSLNESISFFEPFKYYAELVLRDSAPVSETLILVSDGVVSYEIST